MASRTAHRPLKPLTVDHFRAWCGLLVLDSGQQWEVEPFQLELAEEILAGVPEVWLEIPEGNGKTTFLGGLALYHGDYTETASVPIAASSRDQTGVLFGQAAGFIRRTPGLRERFTVQPGHRRIKCLRTDGVIQVYAADAGTGDGVIPTLAMLDELHRHASFELYRTWRGKLAKRGGQIVSISTAGDPAGEYERVKSEALKAARSTREGAHTVARTTEFVLHQHALREGNDLHDLDLVKQANPFSGVTVDGLRSKHDSPTMELAHWARFVCGVPMRGEGSAVAPEEWWGLEEDEIPAGELVWLGLDLGWKWDTTAAVPFWMPEPERRVIGRPEIVVPPRDGTSTPPGVIRDALLAIHDRTPVHTVVMDESAGGEQLREWIESPEGLDARVIGHSQTNEPMALAYERFMESLREGWLRRPPETPQLTAHVLNAIAKPVLGDRRRFDRPRATRQAKGQEQRVIDALIAAAMVVSVAVVPDVTEQEVIFEVFT